jgi:hypothetical protein
MIRTVAIGLLLICTGCSVTQPVRQQIRVDVRVSKPVYADGPEVDALYGYSAQW